MRDGSYLTRERMRLWSLAMLFSFAVAIVYLFMTSHGGLDYKGRPLGTDYSNVYAAGRAALQGHAALPFDPAGQYHAEQAIFGRATPFYGWHYPPYFLLLAAPLATLPYLASLVLWQLATLALYFAALHRLLRNGPVPALAADKLWPIIALGFTAVFVNLTHGHNGFLTTALLAFGLAFLDKRPLLAGVMFGLLAYKPQFAILIPLVLAASGRWRVFASAAATVALLTIAVTVIFGADVWPAFLASSHFTRVAVLEQGGTGFNKIQSVFAVVRLWGGSVSLAYAAQIAITLSVAVSLVALWRSSASMARKGAALCLATILATPYSLDYDLMIAAPAIALLVSDGIRSGFAPWRKTMLTILWIIPFMVRGIAELTLLPLGVVMVLATYTLICTDQFWHRKTAATVTQSALNQA
jgi:alpha-1,2-mannosyltransferase